MATEEEWLGALAATRSLTAEFGRDLIAIGGIAVALHSIDARTLPLEFTRDADLYVALASWGSIRDEFDVTVNRRLAKAQILVGDVEVDLYVQRQHRLRFEFDEVARCAREILGVRVAGLEHVLLLKVDAYAARRASAHGDKDRRDLAKVMVLLGGGTDPAVARGAATRHDLVTLEEVVRSAAFVEIAGRNAHVARRLRERAEDFLEALRS